MMKVLGFALALVLTLTLSATAAQLKGTVQSVDVADQSFVLEDGTRVWLSSSQIAELSPGDKVLLSYETQGEKKVVVEFEVRTKSPEGGETTNFGTAGQIFQHNDIQGPE